ncbi:MAG: tRNA (adenosine(37)-N6)-dimethylallyltransferase MiaA [Hydrogenophilales bacterium 28-61-23]|nr:MAG: tRNA (adenosine(37)-N6)-dimethylallyltransferase MiaA [Hydrogenophilales bacterium 28-61-23]
MTFPAVTLMGPTASGKTDLAIRLCQRFPLEIVSVDSALVYRDMDIGTAKPDAATLARAPHHLIDLLPPTEAYSAGRFKKDALLEMERIRARGRIPLLAGGTMLYFRALQGGLDDLPPADPALRAELEARAAVEGWPALHAELCRLDPETGARLQPNDAQRIQRALELCLSTGGPVSALWSLAARSATQPAAPEHNWLEFALFPSDRAWLHRRINLRFRQMLEMGLVDELRDLRTRYPLNADMPSMRCVGYRQTWRFLDGEIDAETLYEQGAAATRQLAKRQLTWLRGWASAIRLEPATPDAFDALARRIEIHLAST